MFRIIGADQLRTSVTPIRAECKITTDADRRIGELMGAYRRARLTRETAVLMARDVGAA